MGLSNELSHEAGSLFCCCIHHRLLKPEVLRLYFLARTLGCVVCIAPQLLLLVYLHANVGSPGPLAVTSLCILSIRLPASAPPTSLNECLPFNSLVVGLPHSLIFWQFWLFFVFKFAVVLLLVVWGGKVYLPSPPSWPEVSIFILMYHSLLKGTRVLCRTGWFQC